MALNQISESTRIPLKSAIPVIAAVLGAALWINTRIDNVVADNRVAEVRQEHIQHSLSEMKLELQELRLVVQSSQVNGWSRNDMSRFAHDLREANPSIKVPNVQ